MSDQMVWLQTYTVCRQNGDDHEKAMTNADAVVAKVTKLDK